MVVLPTPPFWLAMAMTAGQLERHAAPFGLPVGGARGSRIGPSGTGRLGDRSTFVLASVPVSGDRSRLRLDLRSRVAGSRCATRRRRTPAPRAAFDVAAVSARRSGHGTAAFRRGAYRPGSGRRLASLRSVGSSTSGLGGLGADSPPAVGRPCASRTADHVARRSAALPRVRTWNACDARDDPLALG